MVNDEQILKRLGSLEKRVAELEQQNTLITHYSSHARLPNGGDSGFR
jgi:hypothetical protein